MIGGPWIERKEHELKLDSEYEIKVDRLMASDLSSAISLKIK